jgi:hypothetical protein
LPAVNPALKKVLARDVAASKPKEPAFSWDDAPESVRKAARSIRVHGGANPHDLKALGLSVGDIFATDKRRKIAKVQAYKSEADMDVYQVNNCRKFYYAKSDDDGGRIRFLVLDPSTGGEDGFPAIIHQDIVDYGDSPVQIKPNHKNLLFLIYPIALTSKTTIYYHLESGH